MQSVTDPPPFGPCEDNVEERLPLLFFHLQAISRSSAVHFLPSLSFLYGPTLKKTGRRLPARRGRGGEGCRVRWSDQRRKGQAEEAEGGPSRKPREEERAGKQAASWLLWSVSVDGDERRQRASPLSPWSVSMETDRVSHPYTYIRC